MSMRDGWRNVDAANKSRKSHWFRAGTALCKAMGGMSGVNQTIPAVPAVGMASPYCKKCCEQLHVLIENGYKPAEGSEPSG